MYQMWSKTIQSFIVFAFSATRSTSWLPITSGEC
jgi:hypothetical protein